ncbi:MAG: hypothetical protein ABIT08_07320, partial [Bacteroidia bacterium]
MNKIVYCVLFFILFNLRFSFSQDERLVPLPNNPVLINEWKRINNLSEMESTSERMLFAINDTLLLPFIDDFSLPGMFPRSDLWVDSTVFINTDFPRHPPTIGVATFDGLNKFGNPYNNVSVSSNWCDYLTSKPINTYDDGQGNQYNPAVGLFFSFFYEQTGYGEIPESSDHLVLQFLDSTGVWHDTINKTGVAPGPLDSAFTRVQITITNGIYFYNGFRFRFRNYGSQNGNIDHWHIDYVTLKAPPNFPDINDVAYINPGKSLLNDLTAMPYSHYKNGNITPPALMLNSVNYTMFNNSSSLAKICRFVDQVYDPAGVEIF